MIQIIRSNERHVTEQSWLLSKFSFSFAGYDDPTNRSFGSLRVFNDDVIQPGQGFGIHPHADMEIMTYVIEGALEHQDSLGNKGIIEAGEVQRMTAGSGILHSEYNASQTETAHSLQLWFLPKHKGLEPSWEQKKFAKADQLNRLLPVVTQNPERGELSIHQDVTVYMSALEAGRELVHTQGVQRRMYLFVIKGAVKLNGEHTLEEGDTARLYNVQEVHLASVRDAEFMLIDLY